MDEFYTEIKIPMTKVVRVTCKKCNSEVTPMCLGVNFYTCSTCNSITNHVWVAVAPVEYSIKVSGA